MVVFVYISVFVFISFAIKIYPSSVHFWILRKIDRKSEMDKNVEWEDNFLFKQLKNSSYIFC